MVHAKLIEARLFYLAPSCTITVTDVTAAARQGGCNVTAFVRGGREVDVTAAEVRGVINYI